MLMTVHWTNSYIVFCARHRSRSWEYVLSTQMKLLCIHSEVYIHGRLFHRLEDILTWGHLLPHCVSSSDAAEMMTNSYSIENCIRVSELRRVQLGDKLARTSSFLKEYGVISLHLLWACVFEKHSGRKVGVMGIICVIGHMSEILVEERKTKESMYVHSHLCSVYCIELPVISQIRSVSCASRKRPCFSQILTVGQTTFGFLFLLFTAYWCGGKKACGLYFVKPLPYPSRTHFLDPFVRHSGGLRRNSYFSWNWCLCPSGCFLASCSRISHNKLFEPIFFNEVHVNMMGHK